MAFRDVVLSKLPILYWRLNDAGSVVVDSSGNGRNGTVLGAVQQGVGGITSDGDKAMSFSGVDTDGQYVEGADDAALEFPGTAPFSVMVWVKPTIVDTAYRRIIAKDSWSPLAEGWHMAQQAGSLYVERNVAGVPLGVYSIVPLVVGVPHCIIWVYTGTTSLLYRNGTFEASQADTAALNATTSPLRVAIDAGYVGDSFAGVVDEVAIFNYALTAADIQQLYTAAFEGQPEIDYGYAVNDDAVMGLRDWQEPQFYTLQRLFARAAASGTPPVDVTDAGVGTEATTTSGVPNAVDAATGSEAFFVLAAVLAAEAGAGSETVVVSGVPTAVDTGVGSEGTSTTAIISSSEAGAGTETAAIISAVGSTDTGVGGEVASTTVSSPAADSGVGTDTASVNGLPAVSNTGVGTEIFSVAVGVLTATDAGTGTETISAAVASSALDAGIGSESATTIGAISAVDNGVGGETPVVVGTIPAVDSGVGIESASNNAFQTTSDAGTGVEATTTLAIIPAVDAGTGTHVVSTSGVPLGADTGSGSEATSVTVSAAEPNLSFILWGSWVSAATVATSVTDAGAGTEAVVVAFSIITSTDAGAGTETFSVSGVPAATNTGVGSETAAVVAAVPSSDAGVGTESTSSAAAVPAADTGAGTESTFTSGLPVVTDAGAGTEIASVAVSISTADAGVGTEITSYTSTTVAADAGTGTEAASITGSPTASDVGVGAEAAVVSSFISVNDTGAGTESTSYLSAITAADAGVGTETATTASVITVIDSGFGVESALAGIPLVTGTTDSGVGTETVSVSIAGVIGGYVEPGVAGPRFRTLLEQRVVPQKVAVGDSGKGDEETSIEVEYETGLDLLPRIFSLRGGQDFGAGVEVATVVKTEDPSSELKTMNFLMKEGVLTVEEYTILLGDWLERKGEG